jgi:S1-C subfamily serine protease
MSLVLQITSGSRAGERVEFAQSIVTAGRHPQSLLRFDANKDIDVSTRHAEFRGGSGGWTLHDVGSTNGTWVNGAKLSGAHVLKGGDVIMLGPSGPRLEVVSTGAIADDAVPRTAFRPSVNQSRPATEVRIAEAVAKQTGGLRKLVTAMAVIVIIGVGALVFLSQRQSSAMQRRYDALLAQNDSLAKATAGKAAAFDSVARDLSRQREALAQSMKSGGNVSPAQFEALDRKQSGVMKAAAVDWTKVARANDPAMAFVWAKFPDGQTLGGTAFCVAANGLLVTNRHVVDHPEHGGKATLVAVQFVGQARRFETSVERELEGDDNDIAFLQVGAPGPFPVVQGIARSAAVPVGSPIAIIGFPYSNGLPMGTNGPATSMTYGYLSKAIEGMLQMDAFAAQGSSGSPVFDSRGYIIGVVNSGKEDSGGRVVFAVPSTVVIDALPERARSVVRQ